MQQRPAVSPAQVTCPQGLHKGQFSATPGPPHHVSSDQLKSTNQSKDKDKPLLGEPSQTKQDRHAADGSQYKINMT